MIKTEDKIIKYIKSNNQASPGELSDYLGINRSATHRQLKKLVDSSIIKKIGKAPFVFYVLSEEKKVYEAYNFDSKTKKKIEEEFMLITPRGEQVTGVEAFVSWCKKRNENPEKTAVDYVKSLEKFDKFKKNNLVDGTYKFKKTFNDSSLEKVFYIDFYSIERFGKTKMGQLLLYAKQSQNKQIIDQIINDIKPKVEKLINDKKIDAIGFIPPTVKREVQIMKRIEKTMNISKPTISLIKVRNEIMVPQKTLSKLDDRIDNAKNTIIVDEKKNYSNVLLIDDAVGSGATFNEVAKKIKSRNIAKKVYGLAITGSFSGFEVISEV